MLFRILVLSLGVLFAACSRSPATGSDAGAIAASVKPRSPKAEVEVVGKIDPGAPPPAQVRVYVSLKPCSPLGDKAEPLETTRVALDGPHNFMVEVFVPQGTRGHICGVGLNDAGQVVSTAASARNPVLMEGEGEVMVTGVQLALAPIPPRAKPTDLE